MNRHVTNFKTKIKKSLIRFCETRMRKSKSIKWEIFWSNLSYTIFLL